MRPSSLFLTAACAAWLTAAPPATATAFPTEASAGVTVGASLLVGPGLAYRQFLTPHLGVQVGGSYMFTGGPLVGAQVMLCPWYGEGRRLYGFAGLSGFPAVPLIPALGIGASTMVSARTSLVFDLSAIRFSNYILPFAQLGVLWVF